MVPLDDRGLLLGDGLFETLLARDGVLEHETAHLDRLAAGCGVLGLPALERAGAQAAMRQALSDAGLTQGLAAVRLTLTAGSGGRGLDRPAEPRPRMFATASAYQRPAGPVRMATAQIRRNAKAPSARLKSLGYLDNVLARRAAQAAGAEEALLLNTRGEVACASLANVFWIADCRLFTPALDCGVLAGVMRAAVIAAARGMGLGVEEVRAAPEVLAAADAIFLTNSLVGVREVSALDGRTFGASSLVATLAAQV